jgi:hypothetical protein
MLPEEKAGPAPKTSIASVTHQETCMQKAEPAAKKSSPESGSITWNPSVLEAPDTLLRFGRSPRHAR